MFAHSHLRETLLMRCCTDMSVFSEAHVIHRETKDISQWRKVDKEMRNILRFIVKETTLVLILLKNIVIQLGFFL